jgi:hypothetical protein
MTDSPVRVSEGFVDRLGHLLLVAFAAGKPIEGEYDLAVEAELIPEVRVSILREQPGDENPSESATVELDVDGFETALETFLLAEYARGIEIDGVWTVRYARSSLPEWSVDVEVSEPAAGAGDDPESPRTPGTGDGE